MGNRQGIILKIFQLLGFLALSTIPSMAQRPISSFGFQQRNIEDFILVNGPRSQVAFFFESDESYTFQFMDTNLRPTRQQVFPKSGMSIKGFIMDITWNEMGIYAYIINSKSKQVSVIGFESDGKLEISGSEALPEDEIPLKGIAMDGIFFLLSVPKDQNRLVVRKYKGGNQPEISGFNVDKMPLFFNKLLVDEENGQPQLSELTIAQIRSENWNFLEEGFSSKKIFTSMGRIFLVFDENNRSEVIEYESNSGGFSYNSIDFSSGYYYRTSNKSGVSFPCENYLFRFTIGNDDEMSIRAIDLTTYKTVKTLTIHPKNQNKYLNGPPIEEISVNNEYPAFKSLKSYETLVKKFTDNLSISVNKTSNDLFEIYAGTYNRTVTVQYMNNPSYYGGGGLSIGLGAGGYGSPAYSTPYTTTTVRTMYFKTLLESNELSYVDEYQQNIRQKIQTYEEKALKTKSEGFSFIFQFNGRTIFSYLNRKSQTFNLVEF